MSGTATNYNDIFLLSRIPSDNTEGWLQSGVNIPAKALAYNTDTKELKFGSGLPFHQTPNHAHPGQYSGIGHEHIGGYSEKWYRSMPRLIFESALTNFPELIPLNGQYVEGDIAESLNDIYAGITRITPTLTSNDTSKIIVTATSENSSTSNYAYKLCGPDITINNMLVANDQWLVESGTTATVNIQFVTESTFVLNSFVIHARVGDVNTPAFAGPSPKAFTMEYSLDGENWTVGYSAADLPEWDICEGREFVLESELSVKYVRFNFTEWNPSDQGIQTIGLKRIYLYGKQTDCFAMPTMEAPEGFVWVVPYKDLGIGMKHEEVGDIVYCPKDVLVSPINRILADNSAVTKIAEPYLFELIGYLYDPAHDASALTLSTISPLTISVVDGYGHWESTGEDDEAVVEYFEIEGMNKMLSGYSFTPLENGAIPVQWLVEAYDGENWHTLHDKTINIDTELFDKRFTLAEIADDISTITKYRFSVITWGGTGTIGLANMVFYSHDTGYYHIPKVDYDETAQVVPYIVTRVRTEDINASIVLDIQNNLTNILNILTGHENRITTLETK